MESERESFIRSILRNEVTWVVTFIAMTIGFFNTVVIPLNRVQLQLTQIQSDVSKQTTNYEIISASVNSLSISVTVLKERVDELYKRI